MFVDLKTLKKIKGEKKKWIIWQGYDIFWRKKYIICRKRTCCGLLDVLMVEWGGKNRLVGAFEEIVEEFAGRGVRELF